MRSIAPLLAAVPLCATANAQDLYDPSVLRTLELTFSQPNYWTLLQQNYQSQTEIPADLTVEGVTYPGVGVRFRGNTSYTTLPAGSQKTSFNITVDFTDPALELMGYDTLNLNNAHRDPTFCREVVYSNFLADHIPNGRANHVLLKINGEDWGVYANIQQFDKTMLRGYFADADGVRFKMPNNPNGPGLRYNGSTQAGYTQYELKNDGGLADPWAVLISVCDAVTNGALATWIQSIDAVVAIDPSIWTVVLENVFADDDSYVNKGADFVTYTDPTDGRTHILQTDGNETFNITSWSVTQNFNSSSRPFLSHVLDVPELRQRYMAHMRDVLAEFSWGELGPVFDAHRALIDAEVLADTKKLYSYASFQQNFTQSVSLGSGGGPGGGSVSGIQPFVDARLSLIASHPEIAAPAPVIHWTRALPPNPDPGEAVTITASVAGPVVAVDTVTLHYLDAPGPYSRIEMHDDGLSGDGVAGDGVYGVVLPAAGSAGQRVRWYVGASSANSYGTLAFEPYLTEVQPNVLSYRFGSSGVRITEYLYSGAQGEYIELTNTGSTPVDLTGWSLDDQSAVSGSVPLDAAGVVAPGASVLVVEEDPALFAAAWASSGIVMIQNTVAGFGRSDEINLFDAAGDVVDRLAYGDQDFPGTHRANGSSAQACDGALGANDPYRWSGATIGDAFGAWSSTGGDVGSPGLYVAVTCPDIGAVYCSSTPNSTGMVAILFIEGSPAVAVNDVTLRCAQLPPQQFGIFAASRTQDVVTSVPGSSGILCLGGAIARFNNAVLSSGATGTVALPIDLTVIPEPTGFASVMSGETWNFQYWTRDVNPTVTSNFSEASAVTFR